MRGQVGPIVGLPDVMVGADPDATPGHKRPGMKGRTQPGPADLRALF